MPDFHVIRHVLKPHQPTPGEEYDPNQDMLIVMHRNPNDPDDPTEFGHHIRLYGLSYRKEMWGTADYASTIDMELKDLERYYHRRDDIDYGPHPLADITEHYFNEPPARMQSFAPEYVMQKVMGARPPASTDAVMRMCIDTVLTGLEDVKTCLSSDKKHVFPCKGMTGLSAATIQTRSSVMDKMSEQTQQIRLVPSKPLDELRQLLTDRESELETARNAFVDHALMAAQVPEIMRKRVVETAARQGLLPERHIS